ncbi:MAG: hypothetical protein JW908_16785 [Anaerolineales bacterium]|nr:hypothetical protein [Anaerolineales bacterium]
MGETQPGLPLPTLPSEKRNTFPLHGWLGVGLIVIFWGFNWSLPGLRTHWCFFPLWLGYCLAVDGLVYYRTATSLLTRSWRRFIGLFVISALVWWLFEALNSRLKNWHYDGSEFFTPFQYWAWATLSFTTVIPAVFGSAELVASFPMMHRLRRGPIIRPDQRTTIAFFAAGWIMLGLMLAFPRIFFPFVWISIYFITEPINIWLGNRNLAQYTKGGDWQPVIALWLGVLLTAFFWEMWNFFGYPKWIYHVPWVDFWHIFEMPLLGYGGYLPFALELFALYHLLTGLLGDKNDQYIHIRRYTG